MRYFRKRGSTMPNMFGREFMFVRFHDEGRPKIHAEVVFENGAIQVDPGFRIEDMTSGQHQAWESVPEPEAIEVIRLKCASSLLNDLEKNVSEQDSLYFKPPQVDCGRRFVYEHLRRRIVLVVFERDSPARFMFHDGSFSDRPEFTIKEARDGVKFRQWEEISKSQAEEIVRSVCPVESIQLSQCPDGSKQQHTGNKYHRRISSVVDSSDGTVVDVYCVIEAFDVRCPARQHALKKLLCSGIRGKGDTEQDLIEARDAVERAIVLERQRKKAGN